MFKHLKQIKWMEMSGLLVGVFFTVAVMIFGLILYTKLFYTHIIVEEYKLHSTFEKALGLHTGTRVQINGVDVGQISSMGIEDEGVRMDFTIRKEFQHLITDSAKVFAIRDQNVISARVINIDVRKGKGRILDDGDFLPAGKAQDIETVLETTNELLGRVNALIDAADTLVTMAMDTGTTMGALFGSRTLYDNLNRQLDRLDNITYLGKNVLAKTSVLLDTMKTGVPTLMDKATGLTESMSNMMTELKPFPDKLDHMFIAMDSTMGRVDVLIDSLGNVTGNLKDFIDNSEMTLQNADDLISGMSSMWLFRRSIPKKDSVPFIVETLW